MGSTVAAIGLVRLLDSRGRTIEQMRLINALCRFVDLAEAQIAML